MRPGRILTIIDTHAVGHPARVVTAGLGPIPGRTMNDRFEYFRGNYDHLRRLVCWEPRGNEASAAPFLIAPISPEADAGVIFSEVGGYVTMCGHATIALCSALVTLGMVKVTEPETVIVLDTVAGTVRAGVRTEGTRACHVTIRNVPSFVWKAGVELDVSGVGTVVMDIVYGGNFFAIVWAPDLGVGVTPDSARRLMWLGERIRDAVNARYEIVHPENPAIRGVTLVEFSAPAVGDADLRNAAVYPPLTIDRSPCGTGTSAKMASLWARGELELGETFCHESIIGSRYWGRLVERTQVGEYAAVVPEITGSGYVDALRYVVVEQDEMMR